MAKDYIIQKAVEPAKVIKARRLTLEEYGERYEAQHKYDGCCAVMGLPAGGGAWTKSRTGEVCQSMGLAERDAEKILTHVANLNGGVVLIGEAWWEGKDQFSRISGDFRRYAESDKLRLVVNDCLTMEEFDRGWSGKPYVQRIGRLDMALIDGGLCSDWLSLATRYAPGTFRDPQSLCDLLVSQGGYDGLILRDPMGTWVRGSGTTGEIVKIKRSLSFDLRVTEVNTAIGEKTGRTVYKLVVDFKGKPLGVGSGVPHNEEDVPKVGDIVEVVAMDYSSDGLLREPRYKCIRHDKWQPDT